ncbi:kinase-like domain-containing protein [Trametes polyzona]|nr:kinase-like domain-containing protein [Trametes polyzona]
MSIPRKLPDYVYLPPDLAKRYAERTREGLYDLLPSEARWRDRYDFLQRRGYVLRPRYHPEWEPSWLGTNLHPEFCEDSIQPTRFHVIDGTRKSDNKQVAIKCVKNKGHEIQISQFISSICRPDDHCVAILEVLPDPLDNQMSLLVMPYLRPYNDPELQAVGDVVEFVSQVLVGLRFLHRNRIAHRDIAPPNIMMDARPLYPDGYHPLRMHRAPNGVHDAILLPRIDHPVQYYYIDFGLSTRFPEGARPMAIGKVGRDMEIPELSDTVPYDAFKADVYALGNMLGKEFLRRFSNVEFLRHLVNCMTQGEPDLRPPAEELVRMFQQLRALVPEASLRRRLVERSEQPYEKLINDTVAVAKGGLSNLKRIVG